MRQRPKQERRILHVDKTKPGEAHPHTLMYARMGTPGKAIHQKVSKHAAARALRKQAKKERR